MPKAFFSGTPVGVECGRPGVARADAVAPVIFIGKTAARPTHNGYVQVLQRRDDVVAKSARIGNGRVFADPDAFLDAASQMLRELAVNVPVDLGTGLIGMNHTSHGGCRGAEAAQAGKYKNEYPAHQL